MDDLLRALTRPETIVALVIGIVVGVAAPLVVSELQAVRRRRSDRREIKSEIRRKEQQELDEWRYMFLIMIALEGYDYREANDRWRRMGQQERDRWAADLFSNGDEWIDQLDDKLRGLHLPDEYLDELLPFLMADDAGDVRSGMTERLYREFLWKQARKERSEKGLPAVIDRAYEERRARVMFLWHAAAEDQDYREAAEQWNRMDAGQRRPWLAKLRSGQWEQLLTSLDEDTVLRFPDDLLSQFLECSFEHASDEDWPSRRDELWRQIREDRLDHGIPPVIS